MHTSRLSRIGSGEISNNSYGDPMLKAPRVTHTSAAELTAGYYRRFRWTEEILFSPASRDGTAGSERLCSAVVV
jgi:hypothetical protein